MKRWVIRNADIVTGSDMIRGDIAIEDESILETGPSVSGSFEAEYDIQGRKIIPGLIDPHVHFDLQVGQRRSADDTAAGSRAALFGGITTVIDFMDPNIGASLPRMLEAKLLSAKLSLADYSFHATLCGWKNEWEQEIIQCLKSGITSFKFFTAYEESGRRTMYDDLVKAAKCLGKQKALMTVHSEDQGLLKIPGTGSSDLFELYADTRPAEAEAAAIRHLARIQSETSAAIYVVHLSSRAGLEAASGSKLTLETCPQYLVLDDSKYLEPEGFRYAIAPPLRKPQDRESLWSGIQSGRITVVATDHCPFTREDQSASGNHFMKAPFGMPGVETLLPLLVTYGIETGRIDWMKLVQLTSENAAKTFGLFPQKGALLPGSDADLVMLDDRFQILESSLLHSRTRWNPYQGNLLTGWPATVILRGKVAVNAGCCMSEPGSGRFIPRHV